MVCSASADFFGSFDAKMVVAPDAAGDLIDEFIIEAGVSF